MDRPEEAVESVNPSEQELSAFEPSESNVPNEPTEALLEYRRTWHEYWIDRPLLKLQ